MKGYAAPFTNSKDQHFAVGPFDTTSDAAEFGANFASDVVTFTGETSLMTPIVFRRYATGESLRSQESPPKDGEWVGEVTRCRDGETFGMITSVGSKTFFFSRNDDANHEQAALAPGSRVVFTGSPHPAPGKQYPQAFSIRLAARPAP